MKKLILQTIYMSKSILTFLPYLLPVLLIGGCAGAKNEIKMYQSRINEQNTRITELQFDKAELHIELHDAAKRNGNNQKAEDHYNKAYHILQNKIFPRLEKQSSSWWKTRKLLLLLDIKKERTERARATCRALRETGANPFGGNKDMFEDLCQQVE